MLRSPPSRRRGLKSDKVRAILGLDKVASFAEAWIEINLGKNENEGEQSRLLRGGVD